MFARILMTVEDVAHSPAVLELVKAVATGGVTEVRALHLRTRELSGYTWYARESSGDASFVADAAVFELRMEGLAAGGGVRTAVVDRVAEAILAEAESFRADLIVLGPPRRRELTARVFGSVTQRVLQRATCPVIVAPRQPRGKRQPVSSGASAPGRS